MATVDGQNTDQVTRQVAAWLAAERQGDVAAVREVLADDFVGAGPLGFTLTKDEWVQRIASGALTYEAIDWDEASPRRYGDAAVVVGRQTARGTYQGHDISASLRTTLVLVLVDQDWRLAGVHFSPIGPPPGASRG